MQPNRMMQKLQEAMKRAWVRYHRLHPAKQLLLGWLFFVALGWILLCLPITHQISGLNPLDHLFISTSALSTTGLTTISVSDSYNGLGELVVLLLIQVGGIGYMTFGSFLILARTGKLSANDAQISRAAFNLPEAFSIEEFIGKVIRFTLIAEGIGALWLGGAFYNAGMGLPHAAWSGIFHSISAFCTAGFSLYNNSFESFTQHAEINLVIAALSILGAVGFIVFADVANFLNLRSKGLTLTSKVIVFITGGLLVGGTLLMLFFEPSLQPLPANQQILPSFFQAMTALTTVGFNTVPIAQLSKATILLIMAMMVIGASPGGTGGGLKSTSFAAILGVTISVLRGRSEIRLWGHPISAENIFTAVAGLGFYLFCLIGGTYLLDMTQQASNFDQNLFEVASAIGTVGLSMGITASLTPLGKLLIILLMFCGRLGPLSFGIALIAQEPPRTEHQESELVV